MKYLQKVERFTEGNKTGYRATYSNGLDFETKDFEIKNGKEVLNIPTIISDYDLMRNKS